MMRFTADNPLKILGESFLINSAFVIASRASPLEAREDKFAARQSLRLAISLKTRFFPSVMDWLGN